MFKKRLTRKQFILPYCMILALGIAILIISICLTIKTLNTINNFTAVNWPIGYYHDEFETFIDSLANDPDIHNGVKFTAISWFIWFMYTVISTIPMLYLIINRLHDTAHSAKYLPIHPLYVFRDTDAYDNEWGSAV